MTKADTVRTQADVLVDPRPAPLNERVDPYEVADLEFVYWLNGDAYMYTGTDANPTVYELDEHRSPVREEDGTPIFERGRKITGKEAFDLVCRLEGDDPNDFEYVPEAE
jgi:hypothetical protein